MNKNRKHNGSSWKIIPNPINTESNITMFLYYFKNVNFVKSTNQSVSMYVALVKRINFSRLHYTVPICIATGLRINILVKVNT